MIKLYDVFGIGNTLMDLIIEAEDHHLEKHELKKGIMHLLEEDQAHRIMDSHEPTKIVPAGATTNTLLGISALGGRCILAGQVGRGEYGDMYEEIITKEGITSQLVRCNSSRTGKVLNFVTPDAERTFGVHLGAAINLDKASLIDEDIKKSKWFYFTGYELESVHDAVMHAIKVAKDNDVKVAMDIADPQLVSRNKDLLKEVVSKHIDLLFMNALEARAFTGFGAEEAAKSVDADMVVVKRGPIGSIIKTPEGITQIKTTAVKAIDTTGAGDLYAAGFLYSLIKGYSVEKAGKMGSIMGSMIVSQIGAFMGPDMKRHIKASFEKL